MKQELVNTALEVLRAKETKAKEIAKENKKKAMQNEKFAKLYETYVENMLSCAKGEISEKDLDKSKKDLDKCLKTLGIDHIEPKHVCTKCEDSGFVDGKYCSCLKKEISKILIKNSGFTKLNKFSSSNFELFSNPEETKKTYDLMQTWCKKESEKTLVYLLGKTGTGKTFLTSCMASEFIAQGKIVYLTTAFNLSQDFLKFHRSFDDKQRASAFENYLETEVLFIDDLGTEPIYNNVSREYLYLLINERQMKGLRTIITSNLEPIDLREKYDERIMSRIMNREKSIVLKLDGNDVRLKK